MVFIKTQLIKDFAPVLKKLNIPVDKLSFEHPSLPEHGDYSTNIALTAKEKDGSNPLVIANNIVAEFRMAGIPEYIGKIDVLLPGFINIFLEPKFLIEKAEEIITEKENFGKNDLLKGQKIEVEHTSPNPQTTIMLGHLRNNFIGMAVSNLLMNSGAQVIRESVVNDRGTHVCRAIFGYLVFGKKPGLGKKVLIEVKEISDEKVLEMVEAINWRELLDKWSKNPSGWYLPEDLDLKPDHANLIWYVLGSKAYKLVTNVQVSVAEILKAWEEDDKTVWKVWSKLLGWSDKGYLETYKRIGSAHDNVWRESEHYKQGKTMVEEGLKKKVFKQSEGAIVTDLEKYGLSDTVVQKSDGTALYLTQDLALTKLKVQKYKANKYIWDVGAEQNLYFKQLFAVCDQMGIAKKDSLYHLSYALINFKGGGKMATRSGDVIKADEILDLLHERAREIMKNSDQTLRGSLTVKQLDSLAEEVAVGAAKYSILKYAKETTMAFDVEESLSMEGDSGPYIQYTFARTQSVLAKRDNTKTKKLKDEKTVFKSLSSSVFQLNSEELTVLRTLYKFPEVIDLATRTYSPNVICNFLFDLAQKYNNFYNNHRILGGTPEVENFRLMLTEATGQVINNGLALLGISVPSKM